MKRPLIVVGALLLLVVAVAFFMRSEVRSPKASTVTFAFTCDVRGRLVPCGCFSGQMGGLTRVATLFSKRALPGAIGLDIGDAIEGSEDFHRIEYRYILQAFAAMGYEAANLGHREAALSAVELRELKSTAAVPMISANLLDSATGEPLFETHRVIEREGHRIALIGVMDPRISTEALGEGLRVERIETVLGRLLPVIKKEADFVVLLAFADEQTLLSLAREFYELNVILGGKVTQPSQQLVKENRSLILSVTNESRSAGLLQVKLAPERRMTPMTGEVELVHDRIPEDAKIRALAVAYRDEIRRAKLDIDQAENLQADMVPGVKNVSTFAGTESCVTCHPSAGQAWRKSGHAHAFHTLVAQKADADPNCIGCHTVGFGKPSGYRRELGDSKLTDVGCESCHGPGSQHVEQRTAGLEPTVKFRSLGAGDCQTCHFGEFSRPFDWDTFWPQVRHGKEQASAR
ncbi:MAG TPA: multiheme c-type cytochrome [Chthoniobacteraceae bacterium]|jgi:hypothetical protein